MEKVKKLSKRKRLALALEACLKALAQTYPEMAGELEDLLFVAKDYLDYYEGGTAK